jgi:hypothetical protein
MLVLSYVASSALSSSLCSGAGLPEPEQSNLCHGVDVIYKNGRKAFMDRLAFNDKKENYKAWSAVAAV